jgi:hypothetical protein
VKHNTDLVLINFYVRHYRTSQQQLTVSIFDVDFEDVVRILKSWRRQPWPSKYKRPSVRNRRFRVWKMRRDESRKLVRCSVTLALLEGGRGHFVSVSATFWNYQVVIVGNKGKKTLFDRRRLGAAKRKGECSVEVMIRVLAVEVPVGSRLNVC